MTSKSPLVSDSHIFSLLARILHAEHNHFEGWRPSLQCDVAAALKTIRRKPVENAFNKKKKKKVQVSEIVATLLKFLID